MKILLLGKDGQVGWELQRSLAPLGPLVALGRAQADFEDIARLRLLVREKQPDVIINAAAYTAVDKAESELAKAYCVNADAVRVLAEEAQRLNAWLVHYSTDYVFDGKKSAPYNEDDPTYPLSVYGASKLAGEQQLRQCHAKHLIFRTSWVYAARGANFAKTMLRLAQEKTELKVIDDQHGAPTSAELIADVTALALYRIAQTTGDDADAFAGTYHLAAGGHTTWHGYAQYVLELAQARGIVLKVGPQAVQPIPTEAYPLPAARPKNSRLNTTKLTKTFNLHLPEWRYHVQRLMDELIA
ncbi:MAG TPA: dTDP-4-dehydrorhamnose reductase [Burkholderiaceae bacterium]|nr:dTDP-4-dehydrorhamnose reductase [Burkholderiaceae bacterium]